MTADTTAAILEALDWQTLQCRCHMHTCTGQATHIVETHAVSHCNDDGLNPMGNRVQILCDPCLTQLRAHVARTVAQLVAASRGAPVACETCGAPVMRDSDVLRAVKPL